MFSYIVEACESSNGIVGKQEYGIYSLGMKKALMKELRWLEPPKGCKRTSTSIEVPVPSATLLDTSLRNTLRMLAVSDEDFTFICSSPVMDSTLSRCGLVVYQDQNDWFWVSATKDDGQEPVQNGEGCIISSCTSIFGYQDFAEFQFPRHVEKTIWWKLDRTAERLDAYCSNDGSLWQSVRRFSLPSAKGAVSFGLFAGNGTKQKILMQFENLAYKPKKQSMERQTDHQPEQSDKDVAVIES